MIAMTLLWTTPARAGCQEELQRMVGTRDFTFEDQHATTRQAYEDSQARPAQFGLEIHLEVSRRATAFRAVPLSTPVCNDDHIAFGFTPGEDGYISVLTCGTSGRWSRLHPPHASDPPAPFSPQIPLRLPRSPTDGFQMKGAPGTEHVLFFVSEAPFSAGLQELQDRLLVDLEVGEGPLYKGVDGFRVRPSDGGETFVVGGREQIVWFEVIHSETCLPLP